MDLPGPLVIPSPNVPCSPTPPQSPATSPFAVCLLVPASHYDTVGLRLKYLTRLNRFTFVTARASLCLRLVRFVTSRTQDSIPGEAAPPLNGAGISPAGSTRFSWRAIMEVHVRQQRRYRGTLRGPLLARGPLPVFEYSGLQPFPDESEHRLSAIRCSRNLCIQS